MIDDCLPSWELPVAFRPKWEALGISAGYPPDAMTTQAAAPSRHSISKSERQPSLTASKMSTRSVLRRGRQPGFPDRRNEHYIR